jgi:hypothetical protein
MLKSTPTRAPVSSTTYRSLMVSIGLSSRLDYSMRERNKKPVEAGASYFIWGCVSQTREPFQRRRYFAAIGEPDVKGIFREVDIESQNGCGANRGGESAPTSQSHLMTPVPRHQRQGDSVSCTFWGSIL